MTGPLAADGDGKTVSRKPMRNELLEQELARSDPAVFPRTTSGEAHPEFQQLAVYLDGGLSGSARDLLEAHLAGCAECRRLAMETRLAVDDRDAGARNAGSAIVGWRFWRPAFALAAAAVAVVVGFSWLRPQAPADAARLVAVGVPAAAIEAAGPGLVRRAAGVLDGQWPMPDGFARFLSGGRPVMRGASTTAAPVPLAPRWSIVDVERPRFTGRLPRAATEVEIFLVDENEELVTAFPVPTAAAPVEVSADYPADAEPLVPGRAYAWKINARIDDEWVASAYVPIVRASLEEQNRHQAELARATASPLLHAMVLAATGRHRPALEALRRVDPPLRERLVDSILARQHFSAEDLERERQRWATDLEP